MAKAPTCLERPRMMRPVIYVDMDDVLCDYTTAHRAMRAVNPSIAYPQSQPGFYATLPIMAGALEAVNALYEDERFHVFILTAPSLENPLCYTEKRVWVERQLGFRWVERLIICPNKALLRGDVLIDDRVEGRGQEGFQGRLIHFGSAAFPDWAAVRRALSV